MTTGQGLLASILASPADDLPRLVAADWLDENGQPDRAEFIRVQVELARAGEHWHYRDESYGKVDNPKFLALRLRERELWPLVDRLAGPEIEVMHFDRTVFDGFTGERVGALVRRGFVTVVKTPLANWMANGRAVVAAHPLTRVVVSDREPLNNAGAAGYFGGSDHNTPTSWFWIRNVGGGTSWGVPNEVFDLLPSDEFDSEKLANDGLSAALIAWAKSQESQPCRTK